MRNGRWIATRPTSDLTPDALTAMIIGVMLAYSGSLKTRGLPGNLTVAVLASLPHAHGHKSGRG